MKRSLHLIMIITLAFGFVGATSLHSPTVQAQDAPSGIWYGTWPYVLPPEHSLNGFVTNGGVETNLGVMFRSYVEMPMTFYMWSTGEYLPLLADSWGFSDDNSYYWTKIREDANWSNDEPVTADDVVATYAIGRIMGWSDFAYIDRVEKVDEKTVNYYFLEGQQSLLAERFILKNYIVSAATYGDLATKAQELYDSGATSDSEEWSALIDEINAFRPEELIASGPYTYTLDDVGDTYMTLHWQPNSIFSDSVNFGEIRIWAGETEATTPLVMNGEIAHATNVYPPSTLDAFDAAGIKTVSIPRGYGPALLFQFDVYPWNVKEVRQATALVIDREENAFLTNGLGATATVYMSGLSDSMVPTWLSQDVIDQLDHYEFDPDRAGELLRSVGFELNDDGKWADADGNLIKAEFKFPAEFNDFSGMALNATEQMNEFGFDVTARAIPWQQCAEDIRNGDFELSVWSWSSASPFPARQFYGPIQRFNYVGLTQEQKGMNFPMEFEWNGEQIDLDQMINDTSAGLDIEKQKEVTEEVALIINNLMPYVPLNMLVSVEPFNTDLIDGAPAPDDPIMQNPSGIDHFVIYTLLTGVLAPK
ncbi:ABC transporter substrate-binding protein [Aggregatilinea lenta]|uniref:ABC transporter substrate-binding protein n=1 Tax=Aggregatilinea lenta TaxID=913108 RepID=UPI0013C36959|nr:ABC transporter substrate-binding protein [Aggregatilinea lenta]